MTPTLALRGDPARLERATAVVLVDGEHYPPVVVAALESLRSVGWQIAAAVLVGGQEKLRSEPEYGVQTFKGDTPAAALTQALDASSDVAWLIDVSDEPVLTFERRAELICLAAARGVNYAGPDTTMIAPVLQQADMPSLGVIGTGKRIGKTAIAAHIARLADTAVDGEVVVVAMGRGGPADPVVIDRRDGAITVERLLEISRGGAHAASDYLEDAALAGVTTIGCRRAGGGFLGVPFESNIPQGAEIARELGAALVIFEGSGSCIPPVDCDTSVLLASTRRPRDLLDDFGAYRLHRAGMLLIVGDERDIASSMLARLRERDFLAPAFGVSLRPFLMSDVADARVALFTTAPVSAGRAIEQHLRDASVEVVSRSHALARRDELRADVASAIDAGAEVFAVEIKAAGIDVVAEAASEADVEVVFLDNRPVPHDESVDLDAALQTLCVETAAG